MGVAGGPGVGNGEHGVQLLGLLQHLSLGRRNPRSGTEYSTRDFSFDFGDCGALSGDADEPSRCGTVAGGAAFSVHREHVRGKTLWAWFGAICHLDGLVDRHGIGVFAAAGLFAGALFGGARWEFLSGICAPASQQTFSARVAAGSRGAGVSLQRFTEAGDGHCRNSFHAAAGAVHWTGSGSDVAAAALGYGAVAVQDVAVSAASGADHFRVGVAVLADRGDTEMGAGGDRAGSPGVSHSRAEGATMAVWNFAVDG